MTLQPRASAGLAARWLSARATSTSIDSVAGSSASLALSGWPGWSGEPSPAYMPQLTSGTASTAAALIARASVPNRGCGFSSRARVRGAEDPAADLGARLGHFRRLDQATRGVAVEFGKLVAIDLDLVLARAPHSGAYGRQAVPGPRGSSQG